MAFLSFTMFINVYAYYSFLPLDAVVTDLTLKNVVDIRFVSLFVCFYLGRSI